MKGSLFEDTVTIQLTAVTQLKAYVRLFTLNEGVWGLQGRIDTGRLIAIDTMVRVAKSALGHVCLLMYATNKGLHGVVLV